jgi:HEAT repeat protein
MIELSKQLRDALEAEESGELDKLIRRQRPSDFKALRNLLSLDTSIPPDFRTKSLYALGRWGDASVVPDIVRLLPQLDERGRISALSALGRLGTPEATAAIIEQSDDPSPQVRKTATLALQRIGTSAASAKLRELAANDPLPWIRELAARR